MAARVEAFVKDLESLIDTNKASQEEILRLQGENLKLNEQLQVLGKRIAELEETLENSADEERKRIVTILEGLIQGAIQKRTSATPDSVSCSSSNGSASSGESVECSKVSTLGSYFYDRVKALGVNVEAFKSLLQHRDVYVVGDLVLETLLGENLGMPTPIQLVIKSKGTNDRAEQFNHLISSSTGDKLFAQPIYLDYYSPIVNFLKNTFPYSFCHNYFDGTVFFVNDQISIVRRINRVEKGDSMPAMLMKSGETYQKYGFCHCVSWEDSGHVGKYGLDSPHYVSCKAEVPVKKIPTMHERLCKNLQNHNVPDDFVDFVSGLQQMVIVGDIARHAMDGKLHFDAKKYGRRVTIVMGNQDTVYGFLSHYGLGLPYYCYSRGLFVSNIYNMSSSIEIEIITPPKPLGDNKESFQDFVVGFMQSEYSGRSCCYFDGKAFTTVYPGTISSKYSDEKEIISFDVCDLPIL